MVNILPGHSSVTMPYPSYSQAPASPPAYSMAASPPPAYYRQHHIPGYMQYMNTMMGNLQYDYRQPVVGYNQMRNYSQSYASAANIYNLTTLRSPYQNLPGTYHKNSYNTDLYFSGQPYKAEEIYATYLASGAYQYHSGQCANHYGQTPMITVNDMQSAFDYANHLLKNYSQNYGNASAYPRQSPPLMLKEKEAVLMEYVTQYFAK